MTTDGTYVEVAVAAPVAGTFHYRARGAIATDVAIGSRVLVPFGGRALNGVVIRVGEAPPGEVEKVLEVKELLDPEPAVPADLVALCGWIADYYEAAPGEVLKAALPAGTQIVSASVVALTEAGRLAVAGEGGALPRKHRDLLARLAAAPAKRAGRDREGLDALIAAGLAELTDQRSRARVRPRKVRIARVAPGTDLEAARSSLARAAKQREVLDLIAEAGEPEAAKLGSGPALRELVARGYVELFEREVTTASTAGSTLTSAVTPPPLTDEQRAALAMITGALGNAKDAIDRRIRGEAADRGFAAILLHGVTGSGKTEVYLHAIEHALRGGGTALVLVPEISLTPQLASRFRARFGDQVAVLHSGLADRDRLQEWQRLRRGEARIALGARSAVFAPIERLAIVVVDEEHDPSFKQDEGVRYHGRDVALVRAQRAGAVCVLGSATPSIESYAAARQGRYQLAAMPSRVTMRPMPEVQIVDLKVYLPDGEAMLSAPLAAALEETLAAGDQAILFLNRRGYATFVLCRACGHQFRCPHCSVSLTYHLSTDRLLCHHCGFGHRVPDVCPKCTARGTIERKGLGTEKVAASVAARFPDARVARLDRDVASGAKIEALLARVARREVDLLVGTQMVTKGHDFPGVTLVGVLCADVGLSMPDFRASERTFQLLTQVAGRAGRGDKPGRCILQTYKPEAVAVTCAARHDYVGFYEAEVASREELGYPPHGRVTAVRIDGSDPHRTAGEAQRLGALAVVLARQAGAEVEVRGPVEAPLARLRGRSRWQLWLRAADRSALRRVVRGLSGGEVASGIRVAVDVDPVSAM